MSNIFINNPQPNFTVSIEFSINTIIKKLNEKYPKIIEEIVIKEIILKYGTLWSCLTYEIKLTIYKNILIHLKKYV